ncbi:MAG: GNAT family N-acetyltransferase [Terrisporobacter sp.]|uniref:GNAT family N-acetyltransferase n=1 Tax=Terrisporobacter sp. TaxID=1965305 RepID=UPI002FC7FFF5
MIKKINLKRSDSKDFECYIKLLDINNLEEILLFQEDILKEIKDKKIYAVTSREEFEQYFLNKDTILGIYTDEKKLIAMGVYARYGCSEENYGFDLGIKDKELLTVGQIDSVAVSQAFRGNKLQKIICKELENICKEEGFKIICTTVSPSNTYSLKTFEELRYKIIKEKLKYGGIRRYILMKTL